MQSEFGYNVNSIATRILLQNHILNCQLNEKLYYVFELLKHLISQQTVGMNILDRIM